MKFEENHQYEAMGFNFDIFQDFPNYFSEDCCAQVDRLYPVVQTAASNLR